MLVHPATKAAETSFIKINGTPYFTQSAIDRAKARTRAYLPMTNVSGHFRLRDGVKLPGLNKYQHITQIRPVEEANATIDELVTLARLVSDKVEVQAIVQPDTKGRWNRPTISIVTDGGVAYHIKQSITPEFPHPIFVAVSFTIDLSIWAQYYNTYRAHIFRNIDLFNAYTEHI